SGNYISRNWIIDKLSEFGYDSVGIDSFTTEIYGRIKKVYNVVAVKEGAEYPLHEIIVGAHRDAVPDSPGADDNGSGTVATLEIARILSTIDTRSTFKFILFDGEEQGLHGSWHYANKAAMAGDSIIFMLNMDMIAELTNTNQAYIYRGGDDIYAPLWATLADSLDGINITAILRGMSGGSDHYPFYSNGFDAIFAHERYFSQVYHTYRDSIGYMNFDYFTRMTKACLATAYAVDAAYVAQPMVLFEYDADELPIIYPGMDTTAQVSITAYAGETLLPGTTQMHYSVDGGSFVATPLDDLGDGLYSATIPAQVCLATVEYYFSGEGAASGMTYYPDTNSPYLVVAATGATTRFTDNLETDQGWTVNGNASHGAWERAEVDGGAYGAPPRDHDGSGMCYQTGESYGEDVDGGLTNVFSPVVLLGGGSPLIEYALWYSNSTGAAPHEDVLKTYYSENGGANWVQMEELGPVDDADGGWKMHRIWLDQFAPAATSVSIRFNASDYGDDSQVEAAVDAVRVVEYSCDPLILTEQLPDWTVGMPYLAQLITVGGEGNVTYSDLNNDLNGTGLSLDPSGLLSGAALSHGDLGFTAVATDTIGQDDARLFGITINVAPDIANLNLDDAFAGVAYGFQLVSTGGTGQLSWTDPSNDLSGTGLTLSVDGLLSGTPVDTGTILFTAQLEDIAGATDQQLLSLLVRVWFICGDIDHSGGLPDISDLVYLVDYMFTDGPPPAVMESADVNNSGGDIDIADLVYLVDFMFTDGPPPVCP
ncbi:MAG: M28 family peptidase, partial [candidate division Zixibacteria bacterium]|nr:M28 family peptidase [candidate division Zixibacteria bacterium]